MDYEQTLEWLYSQLPMYQRIGGAAYKADLRNTLDLMDLLQHPERDFKSVHIAGTNGKGSVSHMLAAVFQKSGYKTGLYTSPHLLDFRERIRINGEMIPVENVIRFVEEYRNEFIRMQLSFFEMSVGMAFDYFREQKVDIAIVEVGMGGRLDSTNVVHPELSVITNISLDHTQFLGNDIASIAREKAGIIKDGAPVVIGERNAEADPVFEAIAKEKNAPLHFAEDEIPMQEVLDLDLKGLYQQKNVRTALSAVDVLEKIGKYRLGSSLRAALQNVQSLTGLRGRWEQINENPRIICDTGHNRAGIEWIARQLQQESYRKLHMVWGMVGDKDVSSILKQLPKDADYYFCRADLPRAKKAGELKEEAQQFSLEGEAYPSVKAALEAAKEKASPDDLIFVGGSTFVVAEVL